MNGMLSVEEAQARILALATALPVERVDVAGSLGRYLAEPLKARRTQPAAHLSAMDGYAVASDDLIGPWAVIGESAAGHPFAGSVGPGQAVRIATGALLPDGAGAVILQEDIERSAEQITLTGTAPSPQNRHVRHCGADFLTDAELLPAGSKLTPARVALALLLKKYHRKICGGRFRFHAGRSTLRVKNPPALLAVHDLAIAAHAHGRLGRHLHVTSRADIVLEGDDSFVLVREEAVESIEQILIDVRGEAGALGFDFLELRGERAGLDGDIRQLPLDLLPEHAGLLVQLREGAAGLYDLTPEALSA